MSAASRAELILRRRALREQAGERALASWRIHGGAADEIAGVDERNGMRVERVDEVFAVGERRRAASEGHGKAGGAARGGGFEADERGSPGAGIGEGRSDSGDNETLAVHRHHGGDGPADGGVHAEVVGLRLHMRRYISRAQCAEDAYAKLQMQVEASASAATELRDLCAAHDAMRA